MSELLDPVHLPWVAALFGLFVGSFLCVVVHRYPIADQTPSSPRRSSCPACGHELAWWENIPVLSWVLLGRRCRACRVVIPMRYPLMELLTGAAWGVTALVTPEGDHLLLAIHLLVVSGLLTATFVDLDCFEIPDSVSIGGMVLAPIAALAAPALHSHTWLAQEVSGGLEVTRTGSLVASLGGMLVGGGVLLLVGRLGARAYGRDAMGLGDVKLLAAGGGFVGPGGVLVALLLASLTASAMGVGNLLRYYCLIRGRDRSRGRERAPGRAWRTARVLSQYLPFGPHLALGVALAMLYWEPHLRAWFLGA
ncbi:MAG: prepilin peptidase [Planctomycetes bacterium]|nr:prepilin peptidase [Planctomycetota bacterium]